MTVSAYIKHLQSIEEYAFSLEEIIQNSSKDAIAVKREISRLVEKKEIFNLRKGFYLIIPPRYSSSQKLPLQLYADKLFKYLNRRYYIGLHTAAKIHGASHQQLNRDYVIIEPPKLNSIRKTSFDIEFLTTSGWPKGNVESKQWDAGVYHISSPALTFVDLVHYHAKIGGLNRTLASLEELAEEITDQDIKNLISWFDHKSTLQRVGYLLDVFLDKKWLSDILYENFKKLTYYPVLLSPRKSTKPGSTNNRWKVDVNLKLESDL